jgi:acyl-homoserine lactone acylase PvdQ
MTNEMILDLYGKLYDFTDELNDTALNILDEQLDDAGVYDEFMLLMDDPDSPLTDDTLAKMRNALEIAMEMCEDECE